MREKWFTFFFLQGVGGSLEPVSSEAAPTTFQNAVGNDCAICIADMPPYRRHHKGPVAPSDKIGASDTKLIMQSCAQDGRLLQGDRPAFTLNKMHVAFAFGATPAETAAAKQKAMSARSVYAADGSFDAKATKAGLGAASVSSDASKSMAGGTSGTVISATSTTISGQKWSVLLGAQVADPVDVELEADLGT